MEIGEAVSFASKIHESLMYRRVPISSESKHYHHMGNTCVYACVCACVRLSVSVQQVMELNSSLCLVTEYCERGDLFGEFIDGSNLSHTFSLLAIDEQT